RRNRPRCVSSVATTTFASRFSATSPVDMPTSQPRARPSDNFSCARARDGEPRLIFQVWIEQLEDVSLARSCRRLHHYVFSLLQRAHCLLLPQIGKNQARSKPWSHSWKMFAVWPACNRDRMETDGISDIEGKVARVATSKLGNERVSNSTSAHSTLVFISV